MNECMCNSAVQRETGVTGGSYTNSGLVGLVMRGFGYMGLHLTIDERSSLARNRLVDFTGDVQVRRRLPHEMDLSVYGGDDDYDDDNVLKWHPNYIGEPTVGGGRNDHGIEMCDPNQWKTPDNPMLYVQELAPWPLLLTPTRRISHGGIARGRPEQDDMEPFFYTSFCNELLCHPRILHNFPKGRLTVKLEVREIVWKESLNAYCAHAVDDTLGPSIHNPRRGPSLVNGVYTTCNPNRTHHHFIDDFKLKLPMTLERKALSLFFTVYRVKSGSRWKKIFANGSPDAVGHSEEFVSAGRVDQVACGFLPMINGPCLLSNGVHDVSLMYKGRIPSQQLCEDHDIPATSLVLIERSPPPSDESTAYSKDTPTTKDDSTAYSRDGSAKDDVDKDNGSVITENTEPYSVTDDSFSRWHRSYQEPLSLSVRSGVPVVC